MEIVSMIWGIHVVSTLFMLGLIWFVQVVHYPLMDEIGITDFRLYHEKHMTLTTYVVAAPMIVEGLTALYLFVFPPAFAPRIVMGLGFALVCINFGSTYFIQVPLHRKLQSLFESDVHQVLVYSNWIRTIVWSLRGILILYLLFLGMKF